MLHNYDTIYHTLKLLKEEGERETGREREREREKKEKKGLWESGEGWRGGGGGKARRV